MAYRGLPSCFAISRSGDDRWTVHAADESPFGPAVRVVAVISASGQYEAVQKRGQAADRVRSPASASPICWVTAVFFPTTLSLLSSRIRGAGRIRRNRYTTVELTTVRRCGVSR